MNIMTADLYAWKVKAACERYLAARQKRIDEFRADLLERYRQPYFFGMFTRTEEQAVAAAKKDDDWDECTWRGSWYCSQIKDLKVLCEKAMTNGIAHDAMVTVDAEVVGVIAKFLNVKED